MSDTSGVHPTIYVGIDIETAGLDLLHNGIVQIGAYATGENENDLYGYFVEDANPFVNEEGVARDAKEGLMSYQQDAFNVNGFTINRIELADALANVLCRFSVWIDNLKKKVSPNVYAVFHGSKFDVPRIELGMQFFNVPDPQAFRRVIDTQSLGFLLHGKTESLKNLAARYGIVDHQAHDALADAMTTMKVFHAMRRDQAKRSAPVSPKPWQIGDYVQPSYWPSSPAVYGEDVRREFQTATGIVLDPPRC
jgi:DNA polymerase III epsilon subunit-like protein